jgi:hypothetical protein
MTGGDTIQAQADRLRDPHLQSAQQQSLAARIGQIQGNRHLQRVVTSLQEQHNNAGNKTVRRVLDKQKEKEGAAVHTARRAKDPTGIVSPSGNRQLEWGVSDQIQRATDKDKDGDDYVELTVPDGPYVLEGTDIPGKANCELTYTDFVDVYATASQYQPKKINGLDAAPHALRHSDKGFKTDRTFRIKPGKDLESTPGQGSAKTQAFRHGYFSDEKVLEAYLRFDTVPVLEKAGETEFVGNNILDMDPSHHEYIRVAEGSKIGKEESSSITVSDGMALSTSRTMSLSIGYEITRQLGGELGLNEIAKITGSVGTKLSLQGAVSKTVGVSVTKQIQKSRQIKTSYSFDKPGEYYIVPVCKVWRTPVTINTFDGDGKLTGKQKGYIYTVIYNDTGATLKARGGKIVKHVLDMTPEEIGNDSEAQKELFAMAKGWRDRQQRFADNLLAENKIVGEVTSILKRDNFDEFVKGVIEKCKRHDYTRIGEMDDIVRGRFDLRSEADVKAVAAALQKQSTYNIKEVIEPRRPQKGGGYGYPRYHISSGIRRLA